MPTRGPKPYFNETVAARFMGMTIEELRSLIRRQIVLSEEEMQNCPKATFSPADLVVLTLLAGKTYSPTNPH